MPEPPVTRDEIENAPIKAKIRAGEEVVKRLLEENPSRTGVVFAGGRDSTLALWLVRRVCEENGFEKPDVLFPGTEDRAIQEHVQGVADEWGFDVLEDTEPEEFDAVIDGASWGTQDTGFYSGDDPVKAHPVLQFHGEDAWKATWIHMIPDVTGLEVDELPESPEDLSGDARIEDLPLSPEYWEAFREGNPAWLRDADEPDGNEKEVMDKLKKLGYM
ncbi:MAG: hypothetical protein ABEJ75_02995 [Candidatus Nanohaloarchaea archaeon]